MIEEENWMMFILFPVGGAVYIYWWTRSKVHFHLILFFGFLPSSFSFHYSVSYACKYIYAFRTNVHIFMK